MLFYFRTFSALVQCVKKDFTKAWNLALRLLNSRVLSYFNFVYKDLVLQYIYTIVDIPWFKK